VGLMSVIRIDVTPVMHLLHVQQRLIEPDIDMFSRQ